MAKRSTRYSDSVLKRSLPIDLGAAALLVSGLAAAADNEPAGAQDSGLGSLQEIVVTATRREESISKVPISITAINQDALDQKGIRDFSEIVRFTPGVSFDTSGTNAIAIRGISSSGGAGTTGIYIDDTPIQMRALGFNPDDALPKTFDLDRVEVLRGPQGTLFGAGSEGGTVRYIMTQPSVTTSSTYVRSEASYTAHGEPSYEAGIAHGDPIVDGVLGYRASVWYRYDGGWIDRVDPTTRATTEKNANRADTIAMRFALLYQPADNVKITPSIAYQNKRQHDLGTYWLAYSDPSSGHFNNATPELIPIPDEYYLPALKIQIDFAHVTLISNTSYYHRNEQDAYQGTAYDLAYYQALGWPNANSGLPGLGCGAASTTATPPCSWYPLLDANGIHLPAGFTNYSTPNTITNQQRTVTQEVRLQSNDDSAWKWTVGMFWSLSRELSIEELRDTQIVPFWTALYGTSAFDFPVFQDANGNANYYCNGVGNAALAAGFPNCEVYYNRNTSHDRQLAEFGELTYSFSDEWKLTVGGRFADMSFDLNHYANGLENSGERTFGGRYHENAFTPKVSVSYQADPRDLYYFTYAKGFRPGGVNAPLPVALCGVTPAGYQSDSTESFELGSKNNFDNKVRVAASVYYVLWNNIQQNIYVPGACGFQYTANQGTAVSKGFDLQVDVSLGAGFALEASLGYTSARYSKTAADPATPGNYISVAGDAISGSAATNYSPGTSPPLSIAVGPQYNFPMGGRDAFVRLDWEYASRNPWPALVQDPAVQNQYDQYSYTLPATSYFSLRGGIKLGDWQVSAFIDNLLDSHTILNYALVQNDYNNPNGPPPPQQNDFTFRPRTIGLTATYKH